MIKIPTTVELYNSILNQLEVELQGSIPLFGKNYLRALAAVQAAKLRLFYVTLGKIQKNIFPDTADSEQSGGTLQRFGRVKLGRNPDPAQAGQYIITVTGEVGATVPALTTFKSNDDSLNPGMMFQLDEAYELTAETDTITVRALVAGVGSKLLVNDGLTATAPIPNVDSAALVDTESVPPVDSETLEDYRRKTIEAFQLEPNGGSAADYRIWSADAPGVARVYAYAKTDAPCEVNLYVEANPEDSTDGFGTPSAAMLESVEDVVELDPDESKPLNDRGRRPIQVIVHFLPVTIRVIDIEVNGAVDFTPDEKTAIFNSIEAELARTRPFVGAADILANKNDIFNTNEIISIILTVKPGAVFDSVTLLVDSVEMNSFTFINGDIPRLATVTYP
jgi:hypothetical protein